jgi:hypothetical protein
MNCHNGIAAVWNTLVRLTASLSLALLLGAPAFAADSGDIVVSAVKGEVRVTMNGAVREVRAGSVLELPASLRTGRDGSIDLKQGATSISVGPDTELEFPALEKRGAPVDRIVQPRGNAFYDIGKREGRKLRVETPYLVGVIKGTQFNVAAQPDATTISLFEGRLEVRASDDSDVVDLQAGEIASRRRGDRSISVIKMNAKPPATAPRSQNGGGQNGGDGNGNDRGGRSLSPTHEETPPGATSPRPIVTIDDTVAVSVDVASRDVAQGTNTNPMPVAMDVGVDAAVDVGNGVRVDAAATPVVDAGPVDVATDVRANVDVGGGAASVDVGVSVGVDAGAGVSVDAGTNVSVDVGSNGVSVDVGAAADLGAGPVTTSIDAAAGVDLGSNGVGVSVDAGADLGAGPVTTSIDAAAGVDLGSNGVGVDVDAATDLGAGSVTAAVDTATGVDLGSNGVGVGVDVDVDVAAGVGDVAAVDTGVDLGANLGAGVVDVDTTVDVGADVAGVDAGVSAGVDVGAGAIDLGVSLGNLDVDLGVDLGLDDANNGNGDDAGLSDSSNPGSAPAPPGNIVDDVGSLLDGLLRRPGRR